MPPFDASGAGPRLRPAAPADAAELIRLRRALLHGSTAHCASADPAEHRRWERSFADWLPGACRSDGVRVAVVEAAGGGLVACGIGVVDARPPGPGLVEGRGGWIQSMVTDEAWRGRGLAGAVLSALMGWFAAQGVTRVVLHATAAGNGLYRRHGFEPCGEEALVARPRGGEGEARGRG